jgi:GNAT superfamily N-acetyltransferase
VRFPSSVREPTTDPGVPKALECERQLVLTLGGFATEIAGATLVTHEKLPVPRFNFVEVTEVAPERQAAFFERALDHYFQRGLRPTFRFRPPVASHLEAGMRRFGFRPRAAALVLLGNSERPDRATSSRFDVRAASASDLDLVASFWTAERERSEFRSALDVAWHHPNPDEELRPIVAYEHDAPVAAALVYRFRSSAGIHGVATQPDARGRGAASALVTAGLAGELVPGADRYWIFADSPRLQARIEGLGFSPIASFQEYELPPEAQLAFPPPGPAGPPQWRPPRGRS